MEGFSGVQRGQRRQQGHSESCESKSYCSLATKTSLLSILSVPDEMHGGSPGFSRNNPLHPGHTSRTYARKGQT
jgi:hypothetical protein